MGGLRGVVMCGGESKRMGTDKGLIPIGNVTWANHMACKLSALNLPVSISVNRNQVKDYQQVLPAEALVVDDMPITGPLNGLLTVHLKYPGDDLLLLACDMINMQAGTLIRLADTYRQYPSFEFYAYQDQGHAEPLCAIYTSGGLTNIASYFTASNQKTPGLHSLFNDNNTKWLQISEPESFTNFNYPVQLQ